MAVFRIPMTWVHALNVAVQVAFDVALVTLASPNSLYYLILSSFLAGSLHPVAGHFIAEHYIYSKAPEGSRDGTRAKPAGVPVPETASYYGPLNLFTYNVGLHNEHHDFPAVPWTRLWKVNDVAKEFYDPLPTHTSWTYAIWRFIFDQEVGMHCRVKRAQGGRMVGGGARWTPAEVGEE